MKNFSYNGALLFNVSIDKMLFFNPKVLIFFLFHKKNIYCGYSLEVPHPQYMFSWSNMKIASTFQMKKLLRWSYGYPLQVQRLSEEF